MKLGPDIYHLNTFHIRVSINGWVGGTFIKPLEIKKLNEIKRISTFASSKTNSDTAKEKGIFYYHP